MARKCNPSNEVLAGIQEHLEYEIRMLFETASVLQDFPRVNLTDPQQWCTHNALLEAFLIHARTLIDFLYTPPSAKDDDVFARHFLDNPTKWAKRYSKLPPLLRKTRNRAHKEVAHLTYARASAKPEDKKWRFVEIAERIRSDLSEFIKLASPAKVSESLSRTISHGIHRAPGKAVVYAADSTTGPPEVHIIR